MGVLPAGARLRVGFVVHKLSGLVGGLLRHLLVEEPAGKQASVGGRVRCVVVTGESALSPNP